MSAKGHIISLLWWVPLFVAARWISDTFLSGGIAAIIACACDRLYSETSEN